MLHQPYISYIRDAAGVLYRRAWVLHPTGQPLPFPTAFGSWLYNPDGKLADPEIGELVTDTLVWSPIKSVPARICPACYVGDDDWFLGTWPSDAPPVDLAPDGFAVDCDGGCMGCVKSVGLAAAAEFVVSGSPVTSRGTISLDWHTVPAGYSLQGPATGPDAKPTFQPTPIGSVIIIGDGNIVATESPPGTWNLALVNVPYSVVESGYPATDLGAGAIPSGVTLDAAFLTGTAFPSGITLDWSDLTSVPPIPSTDAGHLAGTTAAGAFATILTLTGTNGLIGWVYLHNSGAGFPEAMNWQVLVTDPTNGTQTYNVTSGTVGPGSLFTYDFSTAACVNSTHHFTSNQPPITSIVVQVQTYPGFTDCNYDLYWATVSP